MKAKGNARAGDRLRGLDGRVRAILVELSRAHTAGRHDLARMHLMAAEQIAPGHPELARWAAVLELAAGAAAAAESVLRKALAERPDDDALLRLLGEALAAQRRHEAVPDVMAQAFACTRDAAGFLELGLACDRLGLHEQALAASEACLAQSPGSARATLLRARSLVVLGRSGDAAAACRRLIAARSTLAPRAWFLLLDMKTQALSPDELRQLEADLRRAQDPDDRLLLGFALGQAYETAGDLGNAVQTLHEANRRAAVSRPWNRAAFRDQCRAMASAFESDTARADQDLGAEVVFLVGMPRSGSTLFEQVLSAHPRVEGASELPDLARILQAESRQRGKPLAQWAPHASAADWSRLGRAYLQDTARWRLRSPVSTDKMPSNWLWAGAAMAMLPQARFIECDRDPVDTCWSCYRQLFAPGKADYAYGFQDLAGYWHELRRLGDRWAAGNPHRYRRFRYETLVDSPEASIRALLEFCGLPFASECLQPHRASRSVRTASAAQVRQPMAPRLAPGVAYGALLDPLRACLENPD